MPVTTVNLDLECAVALGIVENPRVVANLHQLTILDQRMQPVTRYADWLDDGDPLHQITREYLTAREEAHKAVTTAIGDSNPWSNPVVAKQREQANKRANQARGKAKLLLAERGVIKRARELRLRLFL